MLLEAGDDVKLDSELLVVPLVTIDAVDDEEELIVLELSTAGEDNELDRELAVALLVGKADELLKEADIKLVVLLAVEILKLIVLDPLELVDVEVVMAMLDVAEDENELNEAFVWEVLAGDVTKLLVDEAAGLLVNKTVALLEGVEVELCTAVELLLSTEAELIDDRTAVPEYVVVFNELGDAVLDGLDPVLVGCKVVALVLVASGGLVDTDTPKLLLVEIDVELLEDDTTVLLVNDVPVEYVDNVDAKELLAVERIEALADELVGMADDDPPEVDTNVDVMEVPVLVEIVVGTIDGLVNEYVVEPPVEGGDQDPVSVALDDVEVEEGAVDVLVEVSDELLVDEVGVVDV